MAENIKSPKRPLSLSNEEKEFVIQILSNAPLQGSLQTLTPTLEKIAKIVKKIRESMDESKPGE